MDLFVEGCQGLGLALAIGAIGGSLVGATSGAEGLNAVLAAGAAVAGGLLFGWSLTQADHPAWPGWPAGALFALFSLAIVGGVVAGARDRTGGEASASALAVPALLVALALAGLSLAFGPIALVALAALVYLAAARRRRAGRKYEGLRSLR
jgi:hypothetical protein